ncbi:MAG TPA: LLM class F420-dependent oxidoreductase [Dehalococcoidia bacterium]|nr:LLM class F420-dependent oxidoreductase [Dehalococcoidia bacterium]
MQVSIGFHRDAIDDWDGLTDFTLEAERMGVTTAWTAEAWAHDAATPLAYLAAKTDRIRLGAGIFQVGTRTPALLGMTAMALDSMSGGRFVLGLGTSGPQVIEGWHGVPFARAVTRTRELVEVVRMVMRGQTVAYDGDLYQLPLAGGEGKALRSGAPPAENVPIYIASLGPKNLELTGELADGWLGTSFIPEHAESFFEHIRVGAERAGRTLDEIDLQAGGGVQFTDDVDAAIDARKRGLAFSLGAMGSRQHNFYNAAYRRQGYADEAAAIQRLWLDGQRDEARALVPDEMVRLTSMLGDEQMVADRIRAYRDAGITSLRVDPHGATLAERLETLGKTADIVNAVGAEV